MQLRKKQVELLKELEVNLCSAHLTIREFNKDLHCDEGQEYLNPSPLERKVQDFIDCK
jgi:hypothetical protein